MSTYTTLLNLTSPYSIALASHQTRALNFSNGNLSFKPSKPKSRIISATLFPVTRHTPNSILVHAFTGPAFLAGIETGSLHVPATKLAAGIARWLDLYSHVLTVRILLGWFPNIPWDKQPLSAIRSLCDPYLSLFRNLVPMSGTLDFSSVIGFMVLAALAKILNTSAAGTLV